MVLPMRHPRWKRSTEYLSSVACSMKPHRMSSTCDRLQDDAAYSRVQVHVLAGTLPMFHLVRVLRCATARCIGTWRALLYDSARATAPMHDRHVR